jgi:Holliday junction resolvase RusA-like endonuclease
MIGEFVISGKLPGLNEILTEYKKHFQVGARQKREQTERVEWAILAAKLPVFTTPVGIRIRWFEPNKRRDIDNIAAGTKFILDALVCTHKIPNDNQRWVRAILHEFPEPDQVNPRVEVLLES